MDDPLHSRSRGRADDTVRGGRAPMATEPIAHVAAFAAVTATGLVLGPIGGLLLAIPVAARIGLPVALSRSIDENEAATSRGC